MKNKNMDSVINVTNAIISGAIERLVMEFLDEFEALETLKNQKLLLLFDEKSKSFYFPCHLKAESIVEKVDFNATIDGSDEDELYKLNRDITENEGAFGTMISDAKAGRPFEDIVVEYDKTYSSNLPLKIYGGQHRIRAILDANSVKPDIYHGFRVYFGLTKEQKVEIATINNTSITVSNDLLDRMKEQLLGTELRDYFQLIGLLNPNKDFPDKKDSSTPTVRAARTFVVNYWKGKKADSSEFHSPYVCKSGGVDSEYLATRAKIQWDDIAFIEAGKKFTHLNSTQREKVTSRKVDSFNQFASKGLSLSVIAAWSYAAGLYSNAPEKLKNLYGLTDHLGQSDDPLNAKALLDARAKGIDNDSYRGLGTRYGPEELGRMLEVFLIVIDKGKKITKEVANAAILSYHAKKASSDAQKSLSKI